MKDELFDLAVQTVRDAGKCSASVLQRSLRIGYARATELIDAMEREGIVSAADGTKPRELITEVPEPPPPPKRTSEALEFLPVRYTSAERLDLADKLARCCQSIGDAEDQKKARDAEHKELIARLELERKSLSRRINTGHEMRNTECKWILEDPTPHEKTLVRLDTGEIVRIVPMGSFDYQQELPIQPTASGEMPETLVLESPPADEAGKAN